MKKYNKELIAKVTFSYRNRYAELDKKFKLLMKQAPDREYAIKEFYENHSQLNQYSALPCQQIMRRYNHEFRLGIVKSLDEVLDKYIDEAKPEEQIFLDLGIFLAEIEYDKVILAYQKKHLPHVLLDVEDFENLQEKGKPVSTAKQIALRKRAKLKRERNDNYTSLTMEQTAYLNAFLKEQKIFIRDGSYLSKKSNAEALEILTGFDSEKLRQKLSTSNRDMKKSDLIAVKKTLEGVLNDIDSAINDRIQ